MASPEEQTGTVEKNEKADWILALLGAAPIPVLILVMTPVIFKLLTDADFPQRELKALREFWLRVSIGSAIPALGTIATSYLAGRYWHWRGWKWQWLSAACLILSWVVFILLMGSFLFGLSLMWMYDE